MKIQQHDGVVVDAGVTAAGLPRSTTRGRGVAWEREAPRLKGAAAPSLPPLYRPPRGCAGPRRWDLLGGRRPRGGVPPKPGGAPPPPTLGFPTLGAWGGPRGAHQPTLGWFPSPLSPWGPPGWVASPGGPLGPFRWSRYNTGDPRNSLDGRNCTSYI